MANALNTSRDSQAPLIPESAQEYSSSSATDQGSGGDERTRKRDFFRFGRKEDDKKKAKSPSAQPGGLRPVSPLASIDNLRSPGSPARNHPYGIATSPRGIRSASPRTHSPASSMIFERNVQEDVAVPQASPQIPSHILTENHIPPALDATSEAITDEKLDPDTVEIVTHATHQPAAVTITGGHHEQPISPVMSEDMLVAPTMPRSDPDNTSSYASLDSVDVRRLSFISFADVVHGEQDYTEPRRDSTNITGHIAASAPRSPSPIRSPVSAVAGTSPPTSVSPSFYDTSPHRPGSDLNIETMRQALRKTGSGDLSGFRTAPLSPVATEDSADKILK